MGLIAGSTLLAEVTLTRLFSIGQYHHLAFLIISTALLGTGIAGVWVSVSEKTIAPARSALGYAISLPIAFALSQVLRPEPLQLAIERLELLRLGALYLLLALPFFLSGLTIALLLTRYAKRAPALYSADLLGAGAGSFMALLGLSLLGGRGALLFAAALGAVGAAALAQDKLRKGAAMISALLLLATPFSSAILPLHISSAKVTRGGEPFSKVLADSSMTKHTAENAIARVDLVDFGRFGKRLMIDAGSAAVRIPAGRPSLSDATLPYELRAEARVLIIGSGAGWEVEEALLAGASSVDAVEINPLVVAHIPPALLQNQKVNWWTDEGRSFLERDDARYDAIVMIHTISNAATAAGAMQLSEDYLLTIEALRALLARLNERGILLLTRPEAQLPRLLVSLREASKDVGDIGPRLFAWGERSVGPSFYSAALYSKAPLNSADRTMITQRIKSRRGLRFLIAPQLLPKDPLYAGILKGRSIETLEQLAGTQLRPAIDDRPFFHQRRKFSELGLKDAQTALGAKDRARMALEDQPLAEISLLMLLAETTLIGGLALLLPIFFRSRGETSIKRRAATAIYYAALGLGFMLTEIALIQRLSLLLGRPAVTFATVFAGLLIGAGIGSRLSARLSRPVLAPTAAALVALGLGAGLQTVLQPALGLPAAGRILFALMIVAPVGIVLGGPFPLGLLKSQTPKAARLIPWAFAINGVASIAGTVLALIFATELGFSGVFFIAAGVYGLAALLFAWI